MIVQTRIEVFIGTGFCADQHRSVNWHWKLCRPALKFSLALHMMALTTMELFIGTGNDCTDQQGSFHWHWTLWRPAQKCSLALHMILLPAWKCSSTPDTIVQTSIDVSIDTEHDCTDQQKSVHLHWTWMYRLA